MKSVNIDGNGYEAGGSIIHEKNLYMKRFTEELGKTMFLFMFKKNTFFEILGLKKVTEAPSFSYLMTNDGSKTLLSTLSRYIPNLFVILWRYGLDAFRLKFWLGRKLSNFNR